MDIAPPYMRPRSARRGPDRTEAKVEALLNETSSLLVYPRYASAEAW